MAPHADADSVATSIRSIPLAYDSSDSETSACNLLISLNPEWGYSPGPIEFERFKDGITNTLFKAMKRRPGLSQHQIDQDAVLLRAYGNGTAILIDREREALSHSLLASNKLAPALLARFENGLLYRFIEGSACSPADLRRPEVWPATARRLGQWHGILPTADAVATAGTQEKKWSSINQLLPGKPVPNVWTVMQKWIFALPGHTESEKKRNETLQQELEDSTKRLGHANGLDKGRYVLSHCDLLSGNVIVHPKTNQGPKSATDVSFIDYEYTTPAPAAFDLANHFAEWGGFECDYNVLPTRAQRRAFLKEYVVSYRAHLKDKSNHFNNHNSTTSIAGDEQDVEKLFKEVNEFRGIPGLYWGIWALIQAMISQIDFDYASYAKTRLQEYWDWKAHVQGSQKDTQIRLRERRWAQEE